MLLLKIRERFQCSPFDTHAMQIHLKAMSFRCLSTRISKFETRNSQCLSKCSQSISKLMIKMVQVKSIRTWANELFGLRLHVLKRRHNFATGATPVCDTSKIDDNHNKNLNIETLVVFFRHWNSYFANIACVCHFVVARIKETSTEDDRAVPNRIIIQTNVENNRNWLGSSLHEIILSQCRNQYSGCKLLLYEVFFVSFISIRYFQLAESYSREVKNASQLKKIPY